MPLKPGLKVKQTQRLILTPAMRQSIKILQMSALDLSDLIQRELDENPLLTAEPNYSQGEKADLQIALDTIPNHQSLAETLHSQIGLMAAPEKTKAIAYYLAGNLTDDGYLIENLDDLASNFSITYNQAETALGLLQACDPCGIGARDLPECLGLQMAAIGETAENRAIVLEHLHLFSQTDMSALSRKTGRSKRELQRLKAVLTNLNPTPGRQHKPEANHALVADILVSENASGFSIESNNSTTPSLTVDTSSLTALRSKDQDAIDFLNLHKLRANNLIRAIEARSTMLIRIVKTIVARQHRFFTDGHAYLIPMTQANLAADLAVHPSTVARALTNKSLACSSGAFPLSFFFTSGINSVDGKSTLSAYVIQQKIRKIIATETARDVLSDLMITTLLRNSGVDITRRTVAKYRQCLKVSSSAQRRKSKRFL